jgi:hypothetical protein
VVYSRAGLREGVDMGRFGRFLALPWLMLALLAQGLAPAQAAAMPRDAFGQPICTGMGVGGPGQKQSPIPAGHSHDCCAALCQGATPLAPPPMGLASLTPPSRSVVAAFARAANLGPRGPPDRFAEPRGPPALS